MSTAIWMERIREVPPRFKARMAGGHYVFSVLTALFLELFLGGRLGYAANIIQMSGMAAVTLLSYETFKAVNKSLSLLALSFNLAGLTFEAFRLNPHGVNIAIVFHGVFCILIGYLIFRPAFLPRILGVLMAFAGLSWLTFSLASLANYLSPHNLACGLVGEAKMPNDGGTRVAQRVRSSASGSRHLQQIRGALQRSIEGKTTIHLQRNGGLR